MKVRVVVPPDEFISAADLGLTDDAAVQAAVQFLDGPDGWLQMSLGPQTLEATSPNWHHVYWDPAALPLGPIIEVESLTYTDPDGDEQTVDDIDYRLIRNILHFESWWSVPSHICAPDAIRIRYRAGWDEDTTGIMPQPIIQAIGLLASKNVSSASTAINGAVKSVEIPGVMTKTYDAASSAASQVANAEAIRNLLSGYRQRRFM